MQPPDTRYAKSGDVHVAYQVFGDGPINLVFAPPFVSNVENYWDEPDFARWLLRARELRPGRDVRQARDRQVGSGP